MKSLLLRRSAVMFVCFAAGWLVASAVWQDAAAGARRIIPAQQAAKARSATERDDLLQTVLRAGGPGAQIKAALALAASLTPADFRRMLEQERFMPAAAQNPFARAVLRRWIDADPAAAAKWCAGNSDSSLTEAMRLWTERDPAAARAFIASLPPRHRDNAIRGCADALAATDPAAALSFIARSPGNDDAWNFRDTFRQLATRDPRWLLDHAESLPASLRKAAREAAATEMVKNDFAAAVTWARQQPDHQGLLEKVLSGAKDKGAALSLVASLPANKQLDLVNAFSHQWFRKDPEAMLVQLRTATVLSDNAVQQLLHAAAYQLAVTDPAAAAAQLQAQFPVNLDHWARPLASEWASQDPGAAKAWAFSLPAGTAREQAMQAIAESEKAQSAGTAGTAVERVLAGLKGSGYVEQGAVLNLSAAERAAVLQEISGTKGYNVERGMQEYFPAEYMQWLTKQPETPETQNKIPQFVQQWAGEEPEKAAAWVLKLPAGESRNAVAGSVAAQWLAVDPAAARKWVQSLPAGPERERALQAVSPAASPQR